MWSLSVLLARPTSCLECVVCSQTTAKMCVVCYGRAGCHTWSKGDNFNPDRAPPCACVARRWESCISSRARRANRPRGPARGWEQLATVVQDCPSSAKSRTRTRTNCEDWWHSRQHWNQTPRIITLTHQGHEVHRLSSQDDLKHSERTSVLKLPSFTRVNDHVAKLNKFDRFIPMGGTYEMNLATNV